MGALADRLNGLVVKVNSPDGRVSATVYNRDHLELRSQPGACPRYDEATLAHQLTRLAAAVWVELQRRYRAVFCRTTWI